MSKHDGPLFWGGEYAKEIFLTQARRVVQLKSKLLSHTQSNKPDFDPPLFEFKLCSGVALKSRAQWAKLMVKGSGPVQRALTRNRFLSLFTFLSPWHRVYLSLDEDGLSIYESKSSTTALVFVSCKDITSLNVEQGLPTHRIRDSKASAFAEDLFNVVLTTKHGDALYVRLHDCSSRVAWHFALDNIFHVLKSTSLNSKPSSLSIARMQVNGLTVEAFATRIRTLFSRQLTVTDADQSDAAHNGVSNIPTNAAADPDSAAVDATVPSSVDAPMSANADINGTDTETDTAIVKPRSFIERLSTSVRVSFAAAASSASNSSSSSSSSSASSASSSAASRPSILRTSGSSLTTRAGSGVSPGASSASATGSRGTMMMLGGVIGSVEGLFSKLREDSQLNKLSTLKELSREEEEDEDNSSGSSEDDAVSNF